MPFYNGRVVSNEYLQKVGTQGATGAQGYTGAQGISAVSSVLTSDVTIVNDSNQTDILVFNLPTGSFYVGMQFKFEFHALLSYAGTSGAMRVRMFLCGNPSTLVISERASSASDIFCKFEGLATIRSLGTTGSYQATGLFSAFDSTSTIWTKGNIESSTIEIDTTAVSPEVEFTFKWATADPSNSITVKNASISYL